MQCVKYYERIMRELETKIHKWKRRNGIDGMGVTKKEGRREEKGEETVIKIEEKNVVISASVMIVIKETGKDLEGTGHNVIDVLFRHLVGGNV